jgi:hypothetical protein
MKKFLSLSAVALMGMALISSCSKSSSSTSSSYSMKATVNGAAFNGTNCIATISGTTLALNGGSYTTATPTYPYFTIGIENYSGVGTYALNGSTSNIAGIDSSASSVLASAYGTVTITSVSPNIVGTFSFTLSDSTKVTSGTFTAKN